MAQEHVVFKDPDHNANFCMGWSLRSSESARCSGLALRVQDVAQKPRGNALTIAFTAWPVQYHVLAGGVGGHRFPPPLLYHLPSTTSPVPAPPAPFRRTPGGGRCQQARPLPRRAAACPSPGCGLPPPCSRLPTRGEHFDAWSRGRGCRQRGQRTNAAGRGRGRHGWPTVGAAFGGAGGRRRRPAAGTAAHGRGQWWARLTVEVGSGWRRWRRVQSLHRPSAAGGAGGTGGRGAGGRMSG